MKQKTLIQLVVIMWIMTSLSACGFALRGSQALPESLTQVVINAPLQYSPMSQALAERLPVYQLSPIVNPRVNAQTLTETSAEKTVILVLQPEKFERRLLSVFSTGQVAEYELVYTVEYEVIFPSRQAIRNSLTVSREYQDDPDQILAKSRELELILNELRAESADRLIRLLSSQYNQSTMLTGSSVNRDSQNQLPSNTVQVES